MLLHDITAISSINKYSVDYVVCYGTLSTIYNNNIKTNCRQESDQNNYGRSAKGMLQ